MMRIRAWGRMNHDELARFDGHPWFQPPEGGDWIRCHHRRTLTLTLTLADHAAA